MKKKYLLANFVLFIISTFLGGLFIKSQLKNGSILLNEAIAMLLFSISLPLKIYNIKTGQYIILVALLILIFSPLSYSYTITDGSISTTYHETKFTSMISAILFLALMLFIAFNYQTMINLYRFLTKGTDNEQNEHLSKEIEFYYNKFKAYPSAELVDIFEMYNDYPVEAQLALKKIKEEKGIN